MPRTAREALIEYVEAYSTGDIERALRLVSDTAVFDVGRGRHEGAAAIRQFHERLRALHSVSTVVSADARSATQARAVLEQRDDDLVPLGITDIQLDVDVEVGADGRIMRFTARPTPESLARIAAARDAGLRSKGVEPKPAPSAPPGLAFTLEIRAQVGTPMRIGPVPQGERRIVSITGGTFEGPDIRGRVLPGADWQIIHDDGLSELDSRYALESDAGELVYVQNAGIRHAAPDVMRDLLAGRPVDPSLVYFRTVPRFETSAPRLKGLTRSIFIGAGERYPDEVVIRVWRVV